ncbi:MAG: 6,7-dimethyl-8-ribityllumazine synthase [Chlorobi bacterium]|nr:6,7-dimethyl-8-ribityllumazine synthase [Chlorobiota bacterium]
MDTKKKNLSNYNSEIPSAKNMNFGIVVSEWNEKITFALRDGAINTFIENGAEKENIIVKYVPGSFELTLGAKLMAEYLHFDAILCLGCVIQGETRHFDFICQGVTQGITQLNLDYQIPFIYGLLTTNTYQQALDRAGGKHGNKGVEAAVTAIKMVNLKNGLKDNFKNIK